MNSGLCLSSKCIRGPYKSICLVQLKRQLSINSAINRSLRKSQPHARRPSNETLPTRRDGEESSGYQSSRNASKENLLQGRKAAFPIAIPYTTSSSEFLYGTSSVKAALEARRRKFYKLYVYAGDNVEASEESFDIRRLALRNGVPTERMREDKLRLMDKMSNGRPHNGYILESSALPKLPVASFASVSAPNAPFHVQLEHQSREEVAVNGKDTTISYEPRSPRYPIVLLLDGIVDAGNYGAILRSAYFLGADAVASTTHCAALTPVALKASAGAAESLPLMTVPRPFSFLDNCRSRGWKVFAGDTPSDRKGLKTLTTSQVTQALSKHPTILILGNEGEGVRERILRKADCVVSIGGQRMGQGGVDSLNVSVAAGLLMAAFLQ